MASPVRLKNAASKAGTAHRPEQRGAAWRRDGIRPPVAVWTLRQLITFLIGVEHNRLAALWWLIALRGLPRREAAALDCDDLDSGTCELTISRQLVAQPGEPYCGPPKSRASSRTIALDETGTRSLLLARGNPVAGAGGPERGMGVQTSLCFQLGNRRVSAMETNGPVSADEASSALAAATQARARVAWIGYPAWYWLMTGAGLGALCYAALLPSWWDLAIAPGAGAALFIAGRAASRARGVRERCQRGAMTWRDRVILAGPAALVMLAGSAASKFAAWPLAVPAVLAGVLCAGTGLILSARAGRP